MKRSSKQI